MSIPPPRVLAIAGSDSGGGAGIQADLKTMLALGVHGMTVVCAVTAQNSVGVQGYWELPPEAVRAQLESVLSDIGTQAVKTGMLASPVLVATVADGLAEVMPRNSGGRPPGQEPRGDSGGRPPGQEPRGDSGGRPPGQEPRGDSGGRPPEPTLPIVVDPVAVSKHGDSLLSAGTLDAVRDRLLPLATVVTPNLLEAELLTGMIIRDEEQMLAAARMILAAGPQWVLVKGGHLPGNPVDLLVDRERVLRFPGERIVSVHTHGTGCTLASAIACRLAWGDDVPTAVKAAKEYVTGAIAAGFPLGSGIGPVDHGWRLRAAGTCRSGRARLPSG